MTQPIDEPSESPDADAFEDYGTFVCGNCLEEPEIQRHILQNASANKCSFCGRRDDQPIAADAEEVAAYVQECLESEYEDAAHHVTYISAEGGYQARTRSSFELLIDEGLECSEAVFDYLVAELPDNAWVERDHNSLHPFDTLQHGWDGFSHAVKHRTRYLFFESPDGSTRFDDDIRPEEMLDALGNLIRELELVRELPAGQLIYRVREHGADEAFTGLTDLGPPPSDKALYSNRMSPAGISMLYAAEDPATAAAETVRAGSQKSAFTVAELRIESPIAIVDLVGLPPNQGIFTPNTTREERARLNFIHSFARDVARPIVQDGREHIEYVPTQVVTEYLRFRFRGSDQKPVFGLRYASAKKAGGVNLALFVGYDDLEQESWMTPHPVVVTLHAATKHSTASKGNGGASTP